MGRGAFKDQRRAFKLPKGVERPAAAGQEEAHLGPVLLPRNGRRTGSFTVTGR